METEFSRESNGNYMILESLKGDLNFEMKMVCENDINGLLLVNPRQINNKYKYVYNITGKNNMSEAFSKNRMKSGDLYTLINCLRSVIEEVSGYMLEESGLLLDPEKVYIDNSSENYYFTYFKNEESGIFWQNLKTFFEYILGIIDHTDNEVVTLAYGIYKKICTNQSSLEELFTVERKKETEIYEIKTETQEIKEVLPEVVEEECEVVDRGKLYLCYGVFAILGMLGLLGLLFLLVKNNKPGGLLFLGCGVGAYFYYKWFDANKCNMIKIVKKEQEIPYHKDIIRVIMPPKAEDNLTTILQPEEIKRMELSWQENGIIKNFSLKDTVVLGSALDGRADCVIHGEGISRTHAKIINENASFFIKDLNSTNGTYVNNTLLSSYQIVALKPNDKIKIGNVEMLFH